MTSTRPKRITVNAEFSSFDAFVTQWVRDVSSSGAFVQTQTKLAVGDRVEVSFTVIADKVYEVQAEAIVSRVSMEPRGVGVSFESFSGDSETQLNELLRAQNAGDKKS